MGRFLGRVCVGCLVSFPAVCILTGGVQNGFTVLMLSIICTAGIALVVWIPVWWITGYVTLAVVSRIRTQVNDPPGDRHAAAPFQTNFGELSDIALANYIRKASAKGLDQDEITRRLQSNGWVTEEIQSAIQDFLSSKSKAHHK